MFLITTGDQRFWKIDEPVLFLGEWCRIYYERHIWGKLDFEILPYHWDNRKKLYEDYIYINNIYERILTQLTVLLNKYHGENHSLRYWRIIIGPWLFCFIGILYDRYLSIRLAEESGKVTNTYIMEHNIEDWIPTDYNKFFQWHREDEYNQYLYSTIIELASKLKFERKNIRNSNKQGNTVENLSKRSKTIIKNIINKINKIIPEKYNNIVFLSPYLTRIKSMQLQLSLRQIPWIYYSNIRTPDSKINTEKRGGILLNDSDDRFIRLLKIIIPEQIPQSYIESYGLLKDEVFKVYPLNPKIIFTSNDHFHNEGFKIWAASCVEKGTKFVGMQHGGFEGLGLFFSTEDHQKKIWDRYYTWGWQEYSCKKIVPLSANKLTGIKIKSNTGGRILMVNTNFSRYFYAMQAMPIGSSGVEQYLQYIFKFIHHLNMKVRNLLTIRLNPHDIKDFQKKYIGSEFPDLKLYLGTKSMYEQMRECRLFICNNNGTTYLEAFAANFPSILFWNPGQWELRDSAKPFFDDLQRVGILHYTPETAAELVNDIYEDPMSWWMQDEVQVAKNNFCYEFARTSKNWLKEWAGFLKQLTKEI